MDNSRKIVVDLLEQVLNQGAYSNIVLGSKLNKSDLNDKDKALVTEILYGTLKYKYSIDKILNYYLKNGFDGVEPLVINILRISIYQIKYLNKVPEFAVVNEAVELAKKNVSIGASKLINGVLRNYLRGKDINYCITKNKIEILCYKYSFAKWMVKLVIRQYGEEVGEKILSGLNEIPNITFRVNTLKITSEKALEELVTLGYDASKGYICSEAITVSKGKSIEKNPLFVEGKITVQDESAMLVAKVMDLTFGLKVLDLCSAPGGKATHISELLQNTGRIDAYDIYKHKLLLVKSNAERLGITNLHCNEFDATILNKKLENTGDRVLIDVPCSGFGIIRKKPEIKWTKNKAELKDIIEIQRKVMRNASRYVKVGGKLLYSTCTLNKEENEENIKWFLDEFPGYKVEPIFLGKYGNLIYNIDGSVTIIPNQSMDGFFMAKFIRIG